jgi:hypothetical protein
VSYTIDCMCSGYFSSDFLELIHSVTARNARISPSIKVTPGEATKRIEKFRTGEINLIIATSVIEEVSILLRYNCSTLLFTEAPVSIIRVLTSQKQTWSFLMTM